MAVLGDKAWSPYSHTYPPYGVSLNTAITWPSVWY